MSAFAMLGSVFKPTSFAGLFGAGPSVALATLALVAGQQGRTFAGIECRSMMAGAAGLAIYSWLVAQFLMRLRISALKAALASMAAWFTTAFVLWEAFLRQGS